jgi:hypothetical protein
MLRDKFNPTLIKTEAGKNMFNEFKGDESVSAATVAYVFKNILKIEAELQNGTIS